ncbi:MAG: zinc-ribbon domain-containing protein [Bacilli bacterium]|nr:zinc-ribbon domain-containing protein [Bacilli bacterium]
MYCKKCGKLLDQEENFCTYCGTPRSTVIQQPINNTQPMNNKVQRKPEKEFTQEDKNNANLLCYISLLLTFGSDGILWFANNIASSFGDNISGIIPLLNLVGFVLAIVARVKYPQSKFAKILLWTYVILFVLGIIAIVLFIAACMYACSTMDTSGCS